jgi:hypothetical protein
MAATTGVQLRLCTLGACCFSYADIDQLFSTDQATVAALITAGTLRRTIGERVIRRAVRMVVAEYRYPPKSKLTPNPCPILQP